MPQNCFIQKEIEPRKSFGKILKEARLKKKQTLEQIEGKIKIRKIYLKALEEERLCLLPPRVYTKGFIFQYAKILKLDPKKLIPLYERKYTAFKNKNNAPKKEISKISLPFLDIKKIKIIIITVLIFSLFGYLAYQFVSFVNNPFLNLENPSKDLKTSSPSVIFKGQTEKDAKVLINDQEIVTDEQGFFREKIILQKGLNKIVIKVINKLNKKKEIVRNIFYEPSSERANSTDKSSSLAEKIVKGEREKKEASELILEIKNSPTWISLSIDGKKVLEKILQPSVQKFPVKEVFSIISGKASNTYLKIDSQDLEQLGPSRGVMQKEFQLKDVLK